MTHETSSRFFIEGFNSVFFRRGFSEDMDQIVHLIQGKSKWLFKKKTEKSGSLSSIFLAWVVLAVDWRCLIWSRHLSQERFDLKKQGVVDCLRIWLKNVQTIINKPSPISPELVCLCMFIIPKLVVNMPLFFPHWMAYHGPAWSHHFWRVNPCRKNAFGRRPITSMAMDYICPGKFGWTKLN